MKRLKDFDNNLQILSTVFLILIQEFIEYEETSPFDEDIQYLYGPPVFSIDKIFCGSW